MWWLTLSTLQDLESPKRQASEDTHEGLPKLD